MVLDKDSDKVLGKDKGKELGKELDKDPDKEVCTVFNARCSIFFRRAALR
jgi:hypothetical protein